MEYIITSVSNFTTILILIAILFIAVFSLIEFLDSKAIEFPYLSKIFRKREKEKLSLFYEKEHQFLLYNDRERINTFLAQLGLTQDQFMELKAEIIKLCMLPVDNWDHIKETLKTYCSSPLFF